MSPVSRTIKVVAFALALTAIVAVSAGKGLPFVTAGIKSKFINKIFVEGLPAMVAAIEAIVVPGQSAKHYSYNSFSFTDVALNSIDVNFNAPNQISIAVNDLELSVPNTDYSVFTKIIWKISCSGQFWGTVSGTYLELDFNLDTLPSGQLQIADFTSSVTVGSLNVNHNVNGFFCKLGQDIFQLFEGSVNSLLEKTILNDLPNMLGSNLATSVNKALMGLPYNFTSQPSVVQTDILELSVDPLSIPQIRDLTLPPFLAPRAKAILHGPVNDLPPTVPNRDVVLSFDAASFDEMTAFYAANGALTTTVKLAQSAINTSTIAIIVPEAQTLCPSCPLTLGIQVTEGAQTSFDDGNALTLAINNIHVTVYAVQSATSQLELLEFGLNTTIGVNDISIKDNATIFAQISSATNVGISVIATNVGPLSGPDLTQVVNMLLQDVALPEINQKLAKGIALPSLGDGIVLVNGTVQMGSDYLLVAADLDV